MLVLSRKAQQESVITVPPSTEPRQIVVTMVEIRGDKARIGFAADEEVTIHRREVQDEIDEILATGAADDVRAERLGLPHNDHFHP